MAAHELLRRAQPSPRLRRGLLLTIVALALPCLAGCRIYSYPDQSHTEAVPGLPPAKPVFDGYSYKGAAPDEVIEALQQAVSESGVLVAEGKQTGLKIKLRAELQPEPIPAIIDIVNVLTIGLFPKMRDNVLLVEGELWPDGSDQATLKVKHTAKLSSMETFLPFLFFPPSWNFLNDTYGTPKSLPVYAKLAKECLVEMVAKASTASAPKAAPCPICGEPRGDVSPCPHCGMN